MEGRGVGRLDLRIHKIDPLSWDFSPFPRTPIAIDENKRPPMPGEEPASGVDIPAHLRLLGSPPVSKVIDLPVPHHPRGQPTAWTWGPELDAAFGKNAPGTYLIGYRTLDKSSTRYWARAVVTDLCLTAAEEEKAVQFYVTSLFNSGASERSHGSPGRPLGRQDARPRRRQNRRGRHLPLRPPRRGEGSAGACRCGQGRGYSGRSHRRSAASFANNHWAPNNPWLSLAGRESARTPARRAGTRDGSPSSGRSTSRTRSSTPSAGSATGGRARSSATPQGSDRLRDRTRRTQLDLSAGAEELGSGLLRLQGKGDPHWRIPGFPGNAGRVRCSLRLRSRSSRTGFPCSR